jgi:hypothetical protein
MPRFDGTGPFGFGSKTGRGEGPCITRNNFGGRFRNFRNRFNRVNRVQQEDDREFLENKREFLKQELEDTEKLLSQK